MSMIGCTNLPTDSGASSSNTDLQIFFPKSSDSIGVGTTEIHYSISTPFSLKFMELYVNGNFSGNFPPAGSSQPLITISFDSTFIGSDINYYLVYYDNDGTSLKSEEIQNVKVIKTISPPSAPFNLTILKLSGTEINLSWSDSSKEVTKYEIWRKINFDGVFEKYMDVSGDVFNINDENLIPENIYSYKLKGINRFGESPFSEEVNTFGVGSSGDLLPPTNLTAFTQGTEIVQLNWMDNSDNENFFSIERRTPNENFVKIGIVNKNQTSFKDSANGLHTGGEYYYRVKAFSNTDSAWSNEVYVQTQWYDIIIPQNLRAIYLGDGEVLLDWQDDDPANTVFEIERKDPGSNDFVNIAVISSDQNSYLDENLILSQSYSYRIRSGDGVYFSLYSNEVTVFTGN